ncbi:hypothetical protein SDC9_41654 [bioreactor metagenome]|uniref:Uncharacterized protein n=1 Tax=bioreactor metagenome TaxID=1076179 RepID=A0A644VYV0_9ZZZZ
MPVLAFLVGDLAEQHLGGGEGMAHRQHLERGADVLGPAAVPGLHRGQHRGGGIGDEGLGQHRIEPHQVQRQTGLRGGLRRIGLEHGPGRGGLQVFVARDPDRAQLGRGLADFLLVHQPLVVAHAGRQLGDQRDLALAPEPALGQGLAEFRTAELGDAADEVAEDIGEVLVHRDLEILPGEFRIRAFGRVAQQPPAPVVGGQQAERLVHEHAAPARGRELAAVIIQVVERLDVIDKLPGLARAEDGRGEGERVEGHVVLAHELGIGHVLGALVGAPPARPVPAGLVRPFLGRGDIFDRRVEPDVEDLAFHALPRRALELRRHAPGKVAGDAAVLQPVAIEQPFLRDRSGQHRPVGLAVDPGGKLVLHLGLPQEQVLRLAHLEIGRARDHRARVDQVDRVELLGAIVALIAARRGIAAVRAGALDVAVGQEAAVGDRIHLLFRHLADQPVLGQDLGEMLGQHPVLRRGGAAEVVEAQPETGGDLGLHLVHLGAIDIDRLARLRRGQLGRRAVLVGRADEHHLVAARAQIAGVEVRRQLRAHEIAEVLDAVDVGNRRGDEVTRHDPALAPVLRRFNAVVRARPETLARPGRGPGCHATVILRM